MTDDILNDESTVELNREDDASQVEHDDLQARADAMIQSALADDDETDTAESGARAEATTPVATQAESTIQEEDASDDDKESDNNDAEQLASEAQPKGPKKRFDDVSFDRAYRINVYYRVEDGQYGLHCAELGDLNVQAETRAKALEQADKAIEDRIAEYAVHGAELPKPFDLDLRQDYSGEIELKVGKSLHRDLSVAARREHVSLNHLAAELLGAGLARLRMEGRPLPSSEGQSRDGQNRGGQSRNSRGTNRNSNRGDNRRNSRRRGGMSEGQYKQVMEDKGAFMEYVRGLDSEGNNTRGKGSRGPRRR